jgi:hypothetical protein
MLLLRPPHRPKGGVCSFTPPKSLPTLRGHYFKETFHLHRSVFAFHLAASPPISPSSPHRLQFPLVLSLLIVQLDVAFPNAQKPIAYPFEYPIREFGMHQLRSLPSAYGSRKIKVVAAHYAGIILN